MAGRRSPVIEQVDIGQASMEPAKQECEDDLQAAGRLEEILRSRRDPSRADENAERDKKVLEERVRDLESKCGRLPARCAQSSGRSATSTTPGSCVLLKVTVVEGKALVGELANERTSSSAIKCFSLDLQFNGQRARTRSHVACCVEPKFGEESIVFVLREPHELPINAGGWVSFLQADLALHVALTKHKHKAPSTAPPSTTHADICESTSWPDWAWRGLTRLELVGTAEVDWRRSLIPAAGHLDEGLHKNSGGVLLAVELASAAPDSIVHPVGGILHLRLEVIAPPQVKHFPFAVADVTKVIDLQVSIRSEARRDFYLYADSWWKSYTSVSKELHRRAVKIFGEDERGQHRCVCSFVVPYQQGRLLQTPRHAARFVSLLPFQRRPAVGDQRLQNWNSPHAFLAAGRGDCSDHALLLCSLLLGFGLDAFVCVGHVNSVESDGHAGADRMHVENHLRQPEANHMWVCTFSGPRREKVAFFWESLTGQRFAMSPSIPAPKGQRDGIKPMRCQHFTRVACMFNHREFFANKQADDRVGHTSLDLSDSRLWKPMDSTRILAAVGGFNSSPTGSAGVVLFSPTVRAEAAADGIERELKGLIRAWRESSQGLSTVWDDGMGYLLGPALFAYEHERASGASFGTDDFQDAIQGAVPDKHCFKGYPTCFDQHSSCDDMMAALLSNVISKDILQSSDDHLRFALRVTVFTYPDGVMAVWLMLACRFQPSVVL